MKETQYRIKGASVNMKYTNSLLNCAFAASFILICMQLRTSGSDEVEEPQKLSLPLGRSMRQEFFMEENFIFLNHGSYGTYPKDVQAALREYQERAERNPDLWFRQDLKREHTKVRALLAELMNAGAEDLVLVPNTTSGINAIFRSIIFAAGERILHFNTAYESMLSIIQYIVDHSNGAVSNLVFNVTYPMTNEDFLQKFETFLNDTEDPKRPIRIALIDHISSVPGVVNPIDKIIPMLKQRNITVLIDGAHAIGQIPIDLRALQPDYYVTNCHKWLYAARGTAVLYVAKEHQPFVHPAFINAGYSQPAKLQAEFFWTGTMDFSPYMTVPAALKFRQDVAGGEDLIMQYNHDLAHLGGKVIAGTLETEVLQEENQIGSMVDIRLPVDKPDDPNLTQRWWVEKQLTKYNETFAPVYKHNGSWWVRVSAQIYNDINDFKFCAQHFLAICKELNSGVDQTVTDSDDRDDRDSDNIELLGEHFAELFKNGS